MIRLLQGTTWRLASFAAAVGVLGGTVGCAADPTAFIILQNSLPEVEEGAIPGEIVCSLNPMLSAPSIPNGFLDLESPQAYTFSPLLRGGLPEDENSVTRRHIMLKGADVFLAPGPSQDSIDLIASVPPDHLRRTTLTSGTIPPGDTFFAMSYPLIDTTQALELSDRTSGPVQIVARTQVFGTVDGNDVVSDFFEYPITLCRDCVFDEGDRLYDPEGNPLPDTSGRVGSTGCFGDQYP